MPGFQQNASGGDPDRQALEAAGFRSYIDTSGELGSKELKYGLWYVAHKADLYRMLVFALGIFALVTWIFSLWKGSVYGWYAFSKQSVLIADLRNFSNFNTLLARSSPEPLQIISTIVVPGGASKYDLVSEVANTNQRYIAEFDYYFAIGSQTTTLEHATLLPGDDRFIATLGYEGETTGGSSALVITNLRWKRLSNKVIFNPAEYQANRLNFAVSDFVFIRAESNPGVTAHSIRFNLTNGSSFSFKNPSFYVGLYVNGTLVGIAPLQLNNLRSLETTAVDLRSFVPNLNVTEIKVYPRINIYNPDAFLKPGE